MDALVEPEAPTASPDGWGDPHTGRSVAAWLRAHPRRVGLSVGATLTAVAVLAAAVTTTAGPPGRGAVPPNQAGYLWCCGARDVSARWVVPRLAPAASTGAEAVWIGAQTDEGSFFLQVGSNEYVSSLTSQYQAFWSDGPLDGMPQDLGALAPGDVVRAQLHEHAGGWTVAFVDVTQGWHRTVRVAYRASATEALAEWIEEDPVAVDPVSGSSLFRMARTGGTTVADLRVNDASPALASTTPESFADAAGTTFAPTALHHDAFRFRPW